MTLKVNILDPCKASIGIKLHLQSLMQYLNTYQILVMYLYRSLLRYLKLLKWLLF